MIGVHPHNNLISYNCGATSVESGERKKMVLFCEVFKLIVHCKNIHIFERSPFTVRAVIMELRG